MTTRKIGLKGKDIKSLSDCIAEYINYGKVCKLSKYTTKHRQYVLDNFMGIIGDMECKNVTQAKLDDYMAYLNNKYEKVTTIRTHLSVIKTFVNFCIQREHMKNVFVTMPKQTETIKPTYSETDLKKLLKKPTHNSFNQWKSWCISNFLVGTGCRVRTAINIKIKDLDFDNQLIIFRETKNKKQQVIPMGTTLKGVLMEYLLKWDYTEEDFLFPSWIGEQMTADSFKRNVQRYNNSRSVSITSSHCYRHTFAKNWILNGGDIFRLQKILGHSNMDMVRNYVNMYSTDLSNGFDSFNPLDNIKTNKINMK